jgi:hypothetical protein
MDRKIGKDTYFVRFLGVDSEASHLGWIDDHLNDDYTSIVDANPRDGGGVRVGARPPGYRGMYAWVQECPLPVTECHDQGTRHKDRLEPAYQLLEKELRERNMAVEIYSRGQVDDLVRVALKEVPKNLVEQCIQVLEVQLEERKERILREIDERKTQAISAIEVAKEKAIDEIKHAKPAL